MFFCFNPAEIHRARSLAHIHSGSAAEVSVLKSGAGLEPGTESELIWCLFTGRVWAQEDMFLLEISCRNLFTPTKGSMRILPPPPDHDLLVAVQVQPSRQTHAVTFYNTS